MIFYQKKTILDNSAVAETVEELTKAYLEAGDKHPVPEKRFRIALEELLLQFRDFYGETAECTVQGSCRRGKYTVELSCPGTRCDWSPAEEDQRLAYDILKRLDVTPRYAYSSAGHGRNRVIWDLPVPGKKNTLLISMLIAVVLAIAAGLGINALPAEVRETVTDGVFSPVFNKFTSILSELATPLVFFAVIDGIAGIGDVRAFGKIGSRLLRRMMLSYCIAMLLFTGTALALYGLTAGGAAEGASSALGDILQLVLDIIPDNLIEPFSIDNDLQVIAVAVFVGVTLLLLGDRVPRLNELIKECGTLINRMMSICCKLLPAIVFFGVTNLICTSNAGQFISIAKMFLAYLIATLAFVALMILRTRIVTGVSLRSVLPKQMPTLLINITTSSQVAALPSNMVCCKEGFGIDKKLVDFGLPLGIVMYMPSGAIFMGVTAWALSAAFGVPVTASVALRIFFIGIIVAIAAPPIPGSALIVLPVFFASCGIPDAAFPLAVIFGTIVGYVLPAVNGFVLQLELLMTAKKLDKVDTEVLRRTGKAPENNGEILI